MKRRSDDIGIESCPTGVTDSPISMPSTKKLRRYVSEDSRSPSKVLWKSILEEPCDNIPPSSDDETLSSDEGSEQTSQEIAASSVAENDTWYSKAEYKEMLLNQSLTVHIMRSLRALAGEKVSIEYCDEIDSDISRFDEIIKQHQIDPEEYCERGLESYLSEERRNEINASRKLHKVLVIGEYVRQGMMGARDPELVRNISLNQSNKSVVRAQKLALIDQREFLSITEGSSNTGQGQAISHQHSKNSDTKPSTEKKMDCIFTDTPSLSVDLMPSNISGNIIERCQPNSSQLHLEGVREEVMRRQLLQLFLMELERQQNQRDQQIFQNLNSVSTPDELSSQIANTFFTSLQIQELHRLVLHQAQQQQQQQHRHHHHQQQQQQQRQRQQLQIQQRYEIELQRQLL